MSSVPAVFGRDTKKKNQSKIKRVYEENRAEKLKDTQGKSRGKRKIKEERGKGNTVCLNALSIHLSPPLYCLSRCLMVYYEKLKPFRLNWTMWFSIFRVTTAAVCSAKEIQSKEYIPFVVLQT